MNKSINFLKSYIKNDDKVIISVSGGPDSMCLLDLLIKVRSEIDFKIIVSHVNHKIRIESDEECEFVKNYCKKNNIIFEYMEIDFYNGNIENDARKKRYVFFENLVKKYNAKYLLTAHHGDDLIETILMKLTKGASLDSLSGIKMISKRDNYLLLRPLLFYTKKEILKYNEDNHIEYRIDKTNFSKDITRNRYRLDILPLLKNENKNIHLKYLKFSEELIENNNFIINM